MSKTEELIGLRVAEVQALGNYLVTRPYGEVEKLVDILKNAPKMNVTFQEQVPVELPVAGEDSPAEATKPVE